MCSNTNFLFTGKQICVSFTIIFISLFTFLLTPSAFAAIVINEVLPNPSGSDHNNEWVELYNTDSSPVSIDGYKLEDKNDNWVILSGSIESYRVVYPDREEGKGNFSLTNSGSTLKLYESTSSANLIDTISYTGSKTDRSWGRIPDGGAWQGELLNPTPNKPNSKPSTPTPTPTPKPTPKPTTTQSTPTPAGSSDTTPPPIIRQRTRTIAITTPTVLSATESAATHSGDTAGTPSAVSRGVGSTVRVQGQTTSREPAAILVAVGGVLLAIAGGTVAYKTKIGKDIFASD